MTATQVFFILAAWLVAVVIACRVLFSTPKLTLDHQASDERPEPLPIPGESARVTHMRVMFVERHSRITPEQLAAWTIEALDRARARDLEQEIEEMTEGGRGC